MKFAYLYSDYQYMSYWFRFAEHKVVNLGEISQNYLASWAVSEACLGGNENGR